jgi:prepilin peptidase CpaA
MSAYTLETLIALLAIASWHDLRHRRIPNWLVLAGFALSIGLPLIDPAASWADPVRPVAGALLGGSLLLPLYALRGCGAGDVKLMATVGAFVGFGSAPEAVLYTLLAGGLLSAVYLIDRSTASRVAHNLRRMMARAPAPANGSSGSQADFAPLRDTAVRMPYAVAISLGTLASLFGPSLGSLATR